MRMRVSLPIGSKLIAGLELGEREFILAVGRVQDRRPLLVEAMEAIPACGMKRGTLTEPIECADAVARLIRRAEEALPFKVSSALVAFPSNHLKCYNATASVPVPDSKSGVTRRDVDRVLDACRTHHVEYDRQILHAFERGFTLDGQAGIRNPMGMFGTKLSVELHLVTALSVTVANLVRILNRAGLEVEGIVLPGVAVADAVLSDLDRDLGVTLIRIGAHQTELLLFSDGQLRETHLLSGGMEDLADALSRALGLPRAATDQLLEQVRSIEERPERAQIPLKIQSGSLSRSFPQGQVVTLLSGRLRDFIARLRRRLVASSAFLESSAGIVMVGQFARWEGFLELAEGMLNLPVRLGTVREMELGAGVTLRSSHTTALGLLRHGLKRRLTPTQPWPLPLWLKGLDRVRQLVHEYF